MIADQICPKALECEIYVCEVDKPRCIEGGVAGVWWQAEWETTRYQTVEVGMQRP